MGFMYDSLNSGSVAAIMDDEPVIKYAIKQGRKFKTPIEGTPSGQIVFAVQKISEPLNWLKWVQQRFGQLKRKWRIPKDLDK